MTLLLKANNICVKRQERTILHDVCFELYEHDFLTIIGPNGAGKSTLIKSIINKDIITSGHFESPMPLNIGYVPQRITIDPTIPINVKKFLQLIPTRNDDLAEIIESTNIQLLLDAPLQSLSGGEFQRVLLARALLKKPNLLVLDEPAQNLDITNQMLFYKLLDAIYSTEKLSILMVSHDLHMVMASTRRVLCLYHHVCCTGAPHIITKDPQFAAIFGEEMAQRMAIYHHSHNHTHTDNHEHNEFCQHG